MHDASSCKLRHMLSSGVAAIYIGVVPTPCKYEYAGSYEQTSGLTRPAANMLRLEIFTAAVLIILFVLLAGFLPATQAIVIPANSFEGTSRSTLVIFCHIM